MIDFTRDEYRSILEPLSLENKIIKLPSMIAYQEEKVAEAQDAFDKAECYFDTCKARIESEEYAKARVEGYSMGEAKSRAEVRWLEGQEAVINAKTNLNKQKLLATLLENEFSSARKRANLEEAKINNNL